LAERQIDGRLWGGFAVRGVVALLFGIAALARSGGPATGLVHLFGAFAFIDGLVALAASVNVAQAGARWLPLMLVGLVGLAMGMVAGSRPSATTAMLARYVAAWAILTGALEFIAALRLRTVVDREWMLAVAGLLSIAVGVMIAARPGASLVSLAWIIAAYAIVVGALELGLALRLRGAQDHLQTA
jgi:uncharacterized membrane protein HdeD (DUF308 family)